MNIRDIVVEIDAEIAKLQQVKALLTGTSTTEMRKPGRPANASLAGKARTRRTLSAEARERIAVAQRVAPLRRQPRRKPPQTGYVQRVRRSAP